MIKSLYSFIVSVLVFLVFPLECFAQSVDIQYKSRGRNAYFAQIFFSDQNGADSISPEDFHGNEQIFFTIKTTERSERDEFRTNDLDRCIDLISILQDGVEIRQAQSPMAIAGASGKLDRVVMAFPKTDLVVYKPFVFVNELDTTDSFLIKDVFYPEFSKYRDIYLEGYNLSHENHYLQAFETLIPVLYDAKSNNAIKHYSFYHHLSEIVMETLIRQHADSLARSFEMITNRLRSDFRYDDLRKGDSLLVLLRQGYDVFKPYFELDYPKSALYEKNYLETLDAISKLQNENEELFRMNKLRFFQAVDPANTYQFRFYVDALARMLTHIEDFRHLDKLDTININYLNHMPDIKNNLTRTRWMDDFSIMVEMINTEIKLRSRVFSDSIIFNLYEMSSDLHQPYYEIFRAFNMLSRDREMFHRHLWQAIQRTTDSDLVRNLEIWALCHDLTSLGINEQIVDNINQGIGLINSGKWAEAGDLFEVITMQASNIALPWYYSGLVSYEQDEKFVAMARFNTALEKYPAYISPRIYLFNSLYENADYAELLTKVNESLEMMDIWLLRYWKAKTLFAKGRYRDVVTEITEHCHKLNEYNPDSWFLLGDAYFQLNMRDNAREAYEQVHRIDPFNTRYNSIMQERFGK